MGSIDRLPPIISNYSRTGAVGQVAVSQIEVFDIGVVFAISQFNMSFSLVGGAPGPGVYPLNLAAFMTPGGDEYPIAIVGFWTSPATPWLVSLASNIIYEDLPILPTMTPRRAPGLEEGTP